eukprot:m.10665 g.10665  ORF g.10665 m.10665 type:complete len:340 (-) comp4302_c0_seq2:51-1070(-)
MANKLKTTRIHPSLHHPASREWHEPHIHASMLVYPVFVAHAEDDKDIPGFEPNKHWGVNKNNEMPGLVAYLKELMAKGLTNVMLFGVPKDSHKDAEGMFAAVEDTAVSLALKCLKKELPKLMLLADVCLCEYTNHGHCAPLRKKQVGGIEDEFLDNQAACERFADIAVCYAKYGADMVCPSDMMDGRIGVIKEALLNNGLDHVSIMAYTSKKASCLCAPFRNAVQSSLKGDRKRYQQPIGSINVAKRALKRDLSEGADVVIVKPALFNCDIISEFHRTADVPVAAYVVSGEYVMLQNYGKSSDQTEQVVKEAHVSLLRAGTSILITYFAPEILDWLPNW